MRKKRLPTRRLNAAALKSRGRPTAALVPPLLAFPALVGVAPTGPVSVVGIAATEVADPYAELAAGSLISKLIRTLSMT